MTRWVSQLAAGVAAAAFWMSAAAQSNNPASFTESQAIKGKSVYDARCAECHLSDLKGSSGPALAGTNFVNSVSNGRN